MALKNERIIYVAKKLEAGLADVTAEIRRGGVQVASAAPLSDIGGGRYELLLTPAALAGYGGAGYYDFYIDSASRPAPAVAAKWILENNEDDLKAEIDAVEVIAQSIEAKVDGLITDVTSIKGTVEDTNNEVKDASHGLANLKTLIDNIDGVVNNISNVTRFNAPIPKPLVKPESGVRTYKIPLYLYDNAGNMEDPDSEQIQVTLTNEAGASRDSLLKNFTAQPYYATKNAVGEYEFEIEVPWDNLEEQINFKFNYVEDTVALVQGNSTQVMDEAGSTGLALESTAQDILADTAQMQPEIASILADVQSATIGLGAIRSLLDTIDANTDGVESELGNATYGLSALQTLLAGKASQSSVNVISAAVSSMQGSGFTESEHSLEAIAELLGQQGGRAVIG